MMLAALLAMVLVAAAPALARSVAPEGDGYDFPRGDDATDQSAGSLRRRISRSSAIGTPASGGTSPATRTGPALRSGGTRRGAATG